MTRHALAAFALAMLAAAPITPALSYTPPSGPLASSACEESVAPPASGTKKLFSIDTTPSGRAVPRIVIKRTTASDDQDASASVCHKESSTGKDRQTRTSTTEVRR